MPQTNKQDQLRQMLHPLAENFTTQVAATVMSFVQESVRQEVQVVLDRALLGVDASRLVPMPPQAVAKIKTAMAPAATKPAPRATTKVRPRRKSKKRTVAPKVKCSKRSCDGSWYRPSGKDKKLCYQHFIEAGGKPPVGKPKNK